MRILAAVLALFVTLPLHAQGGRRRAVRSSGPSPCSVSGLPGMFRSVDGGQTFAGDTSTAPVDFLYDVQFLENPPSTVVAASLHAIYDSLDGGCSWTQRYTITKALHHPLQISIGPDGRAFIWSDEILLRYDQSSVQELNPPTAIGALMVDPADNHHVRMLAIIGGQIWNSIDGGGTWTNTNRGAGNVIRAGAFNPTDFDHLLVATPAGVLSSRDGGSSWTPIPGFERSACAIAFVRHSPNVVWISQSIKAGSDTLHRSENGGASFQPAAQIPSNAEGACIPMVAHPFDSNRAVVVFGDLYTVDAVTHDVAVTNCCNRNLLRAAYSLADRNVALIFGSAR